MQINLHTLPRWQTKITRNEFTGIYVPLALWHKKPVKKWRKYSIKVNLCSFLCANAKRAFTRRGVSLAAYSRN